MKGFLKYTLATVVGILLYSLISSFIFLGIMGGIAAASKNKTVKIEPNTVLYMKLDKEIVDRTSDSPFGNFNIATLKPEPQLGLNSILENIKKAKTDVNIDGIYLSLSHIPAGLATIEEIREALKDFKESGKFIYAYSEYISQTTYYLASVADEIYMNPVGSIEIKGLRSKSTFFKGALEKIGVEPVIFRHGKFKSAVEPFMLDKMSEANKEQTKTYVGSIWKHMVEGIAAERNLSVEKVNELVDGLIVRNTKAAVKNNIIDGVLYKDEMIAKLVEVTEAKNADDLEIVKLGKYSNVENKEKSKKRDHRKKIAVVYASGEVVMGKGEGGDLGSETISKAIRKARKDSTVKAIVFRINSPGGSALASDIIWREAVLAQQTKPFIVSMGDLAASGGYYIACPADVIVANPSTLTGSIGVFGLMLNTEKLMNDKLGITFDGIKTNKFADIGDANRKMTEPEKEMIQESIVDIYQEFISHVGKGRNMTTDAVDEIGQGRVWSGLNAKEIGLVDEFGGLSKSIEVAAEKAGLEDYKVVDYPIQLDPLEELVKQLTGEVSTRMLKHELGVNYKVYRQVKHLMQMDGIQARMTDEVEIY